MGKKLKIGFAMGGGVSLGSFSGGALTEAIKIAILYGKDKEGNPYDSVEVDVFSGSSAGSLSLALMLRMMAHQTNSERDAANAELLAQYGNAYQAMSDLKKEQLQVAQIVQNTQRRVWTEEINIQRLLGIKANGDKEDLKELGSLIFRGAVDDLARKYFNLSNIIGQPPFSFDNRSILADRVLFTSTLVNLNKIEHESYQQFGIGGNLVPIIQGALSSNVHLEFRTLDLIFDYLTPTQQRDTNLYPETWLRCHLGAENTTPNQIIKDLRELPTWSEIVSTSIASGTVPLAFEPVVLKRYQHEFSKGTWPKVLARKGLTEYPFTYVDGGTFLTEPLREAFKLANFIDCQAVDHDFERKIIFVDPRISPEEHSYTLPVHQDYTVKDPGIWGALDGYDLIKLASLEKLISYSGTMLNVLVEETRVVELDKATKTIDRLAFRNTFNNQIIDTIDKQALRKAMFNDLKNLIKNHLSSAKQVAVFPNVVLDLQSEFTRINREFNKLTGAEINQFFQAADPSLLPKANVYYAYLLIIFNDHNSGFFGKDKNAEFIPIGPFTTDQQGQYQLIDLPGAKLGAFAGFFSSAPSRYEFEMAQHSTQLIMKNLGFSNQLMIPYRVMTPAEKQEFQDDYSKGKKDLAKRIGEIVKKNNTIPNLADFFVWQLFIKKMVNNIEDLDKKHFDINFTIRFDSPRYKISATKMNSGIKAEKKEDGTGIAHCAISAACKFDNSGKITSLEWLGVHARKSGSKYFLKIVKPLLGRDFCRIELPNRTDVERAIARPNPTYEIDINKQNKGEDVQNIWNLSDGVTCLAEQLFQVQFA